MGPALEAPPAFAESRARIGAAKAAILELELAQKRSELAPIDVMGTAFSAVAGEVKTRIFAVPSRAATMLAEPARRAELEATLHRLLSEAMEQFSEDNLAAIMEGALEARFPSEPAKKAKRHKRSA